MYLAAAFGISCGYITDRFNDALFFYINVKTF